MADSVEYQPPIPPDPDRPCHECRFHQYDSYQDEAWCDNQPGLIDDNGTCRFWEAWPEPKEAE